MSYSGQKGWITKPKSGVRIDPCHPLSRGLISCWLFNEAAGSVLHDIAGGRNDGTLTGMEPPSDWVGSLHGGALVFDGVNDYVIIGVVPEHDLTDNFSVCIWLDNPTWTNYEGFVTHTDGTNGWAVLTNDAALLSFLEFNAGAFVYLTADANPVGLAHVAAVIRNGTRYLYVNGVQQSNTDANLPGSVPGVATIIGRVYPHVHGYYCSAKIDGVRIYNRGLLTEEVQQLYHDPYCNLLRVPIRRHFVAVAPPVGQPMQLRGTTVPHIGRQWHPRVA